MKKSILVCTVLGIFVLTACKKEVTVTPNATTNSEAVNNNVAEDVQNPTNVNLSDLPAAALATINQHYKQDHIASYQVKTVPVIGKSYEVKFNDGAEIEFDESGNWHEWKDAKGLPKSIVPTNIQTYISKNYASTFATSIDKEAKKIKIELASDIDLEFDANGNFVKID